MQPDVAGETLADRAGRGLAHRHPMAPAGILKLGQFVGQQFRARHVDKNAVPTAFDQFAGARHRMSQAGQPARHGFHECEWKSLHQAREDKQIEQLKNIAWICLPADKPDLMIYPGQPRLFLQSGPGRALSGNHEHGTGLLLPSEMLPKGLDENIDALVRAQAAEISDDRRILRQTQPLASQASAVLGDRVKSRVDPVAADAQLVGGYLKLARRDFRDLGGDGDDPAQASAHDAPIPALRHQEWPFRRRWRVFNRIDRPAKGPCQKHVHAGGFGKPAPTENDIVAFVPDQRGCQRESSHRSIQEGPFVEPADREMPDPAEWYFVTGSDFREMVSFRTDHRHAMSECGNSLHHIGGVNLQAARLGAAADEQKTSHFRYWSPQSPPIY
nr:hypothetical protein [Mesorhizobium sp.]